MEPVQSFVYEANAARVVFGAGALRQVAAEAERLGLRRALVLSTPNQRSEAQRVADLLGSRCAGIHAGAVMHVPEESAQEAVARASALDADGAVAIGGGSTTGLAKAIALETGLPYIAIPTSYAGSEMTPIYGLTAGGQKKTGRNPRVLPRVTLYDPELTVGLPAQLTVTSGLNAIAHAAEGLYARDTNPVMALMAEEGIRALAAGIPAVVTTPDNLEGRAQCLYGAWLCGTVLGSVGMALHHKLCHTLGGSFNLPHAETHTIVLPHALAYNAAAAPEAMFRIQRAVGNHQTSAAAALYDLAGQHGAPLALRDIGMRAQDIDVAVEQALANPYWNPRPIEREPIRALLQAAYDGSRPA
ncbi:Maleylacetate reductase (plasmid) [Cupriavidus taiwanensis]|uniref:maleylacetate reductase n=1 Tax=Cupriavidus taiwanensis TaxID=164546 RepID=A0A375FHI2_9BURK|nr:maleylacetate reductase [Cupriavidus taiwanensis]SPA30253.1 Maleylacetate reductase [Cupriavidus taiwanensis]SPA55961.1 Maleylacetate reductase [Cupriavidus taiwanensis]SPD67451.1 Maleylacetate reductase [Cupriavidus taiwanensis]